MRLARHNHRLLQRLAKLLVVMTLTLSLGLHWALLQSVAWVGMVVNYSQTAPLHDALAKTFDGRHPCSLCKLVREGKAKEQQRDALKTVAKLDMALPAQEFFLESPAHFPRVTTAADSGSVWSDAPPTPPPRPA